jgi:hypothetical protein
MEPEGIVSNSKGPTGWDPIPVAMGYEIDDREVETRYDQLSPDGG